MNRSQIFSGLACASFISLTSFATADTIDPETRNAAFAPLTVLEDHPQCNGLGEVAFQVDFESGNLAFSVYSSQDLSSAIVDEQGQVFLPEEKCYIVERRGAERVNIQVDCGDNQPARSPFLLRDLEQGALSVAGHFTACQSPTSFQIIDSLWTASLSIFDEQADYAGEFRKKPAVGCEDPQLIDGPNANMRYAVSGVEGNPSSSDRQYAYWRRNDVVPRGATFFSVDVYGIPVPQRDGTLSSREARTVAHFFPLSNDESNCLDGVCALPSWLNRTDPWSNAVTCE